MQWNLIVCPQRRPNESRAEPTLPTYKELLVSNGGGGCATDGVSVGRAAEIKAVCCSICCEGLTMSY